MLSAPIGAVFVNCDSRLDYPKQLARYLRREDLQIVGPEWIERERWLGLRFTGIVVDHAARLSDRASGMLPYVMTRIRKP
jgi:hypothetical protein